MTSKTPITDAIERAATDDAGNVTRMEPIWRGLEKLERENAKLKGAIKAFCDGQQWADPRWKAQSHIKPLFEV